MFKTAITNDNGNYCITYGEKEKVDKAIHAEQKLYPELEVYDHDYLTEKEMEEDLPYIRKDYETAEVMAV